jgi:hypothetical protein
MVNLAFAQMKTAVRTHFGTERNKQKNAWGE